MSDPQRTRHHILILGGTAEAVQLSLKLADDMTMPLQVTLSMAGRTAGIVIQENTTRIGPFGGPAGLLSYLRDERVDGVIDATHPFATRISAHAEAACRSAGIPLLHFDRPSWQSQPGDRWIDVVDTAAAAALLPDLGRRIWLTTGVSALHAFAGIDACEFLIRLIAVPASMPPFRHATVICGRGPFALADERRIIACHSIEVLVTKASGGTSTEPKLIAAREAGIPVVMIRRPAGQEVPGSCRVATVDAAIAWISHVSRRAG